MKQPLLLDVPRPIPDVENEALSASNLKHLIDATQHRPLPPVSILSTVNKANIIDVI